jgi:hypothetical protein
VKELMESVGGVEEKKIKGYTIYLQGPIGRSTNNSFIIK